MKITDQHPDIFLANPEIAKRMNFFQLPQTKIAVGFFSCPKGWLHLPTCLPITGDAKTCMKLFRVYANHKHSEIYDPNIQIDNVPSIDDKSFFLGGDKDGNYWHNLMDYLPRLFFFSKIENQSEFSIYHNFPDYLLEFMSTVSEIQNIKDSGLTRLPTSEKIVSFRNAIIPTRLPMEHAVQIWENFIWPKNNRPPPIGRKLFVHRQNAKIRKLLNHDELSKKLEIEGFEFIDPGSMTVAEQLKTFAESTIIVGVHGAGLTNLIASPHGTRVIELAAGIPQPWIPAISKVRQLKHDSIWGETDDLETHNGDFTIDVNQVIQSITAS